MTMTKTAPETSIPFRIAYPDTGESGDVYDIDVQTPTLSGSRVGRLLVGINSFRSPNLRLDGTESGDSYEAEVEAYYIDKGREEQTVLVASRT